MTSKAKVEGMNLLYMYQQARERRIKEQQKRIAIAQDICTQLYDRLGIPKTNRSFEVPQAVHSMEDGWMFHFHLDVSLPSEKCITLNLNIHIQSSKGKTFRVSVHHHSVSPLSKPSKVVANVAGAVNYLLVLIKEDMAIHGQPGKKMRYLDGDGFSD